MSPVFVSFSVCVGAGCVHAVCVCVCVRERERERGRERERFVVAAVHLFYCLFVVSLCFLVAIGLVFQVS